MTIIWRNSTTIVSDSDPVTYDVSQYEGITWINNVLQKKWFGGTADWLNLDEAEGLDVKRNSVSLVGPSACVLTNCSGELCINSVPIGGGSSSYPIINPVTITQNSNYTYTASDWLSCIIVRNPPSSDVNDTMPSASSIISAITSPVVGMAITTEIYNISSKEVKKIINGAGITTIGLSETQMKIKKDAHRICRSVITSISPDTIDVYSYRNDMTG